MHFVLRHPDDATWLARYGHDPERGGAWAELTYCDVRVVHDAAEVDYDVELPLRGVIRFLASFEFVAPDDIVDAIAWLKGGGGDHGWPRDPRRAPKRVRRILTIIENLESAAP